MATSTLLLIAGLALLVLGGELIVRGAVRLATRLGISAAVVGTVIVGLGTSLPELATSIDAVLSGAPGIAWGNIAGSNVANTLLILGVAAVLYPVATNGFHAMRDPLIALVATLVLWGIAVFGLQDRLAGLALVAAMVGYIWFHYRAETRDPDIVDPPEIAVEKPDGHFWHDIGVPTMLLLSGFAVLIGGAHMLVKGAVDIAAYFGLSEAVIGLTVVAIGTSLPELVTSAVAAIRRHSDIALGNVIGSNIYNLLAIGGTTMLLAPGSLPPAIAAFDLPLLAVLAVGLFVAVLFRATIGRAFGAILCAGYALFLVNAVLTHG